MAVPVDFSYFENDISFFKLIIASEDLPEKIHAWFVIRISIHEVRLMHQKWLRFHVYL